MLVLVHVLEHFDIWDAHDYSDRWVIEMREKAATISEFKRVVKMLHKH